MINEDKKKVQIMVNSDVAKRAEEVFEKLGINPTTAVNALYSRVAAVGEIPFPLSLSEEEKAEMRLHSAARNLPVEDLNSKKKLKDFFDEEDY